MVRHGRSRSFKVIEIGINRKPVRDLLLAVQCVCWWLTDNLVITSVWPTHGPLGGGTAITVTGTIPDNFKPIGLYIGNDRFANVTYR